MFFFKKTTTLSHLHFPAPRRRGDRRIAPPARSPGPLFLPPPPAPSLPFTPALSWPHGIHGSHTTLRFMAPTGRFCFCLVRCTALTLTPVFFFGAALTHNYGSWHEQAALQASIALDMRLLPAPAPLRTTPSQGLLGRESALGRGTDGKHACILLLI